MKVVWTENAVRHLHGIHDFIALNSSTYAKRTIDRITRRSEQIVDQPLSGRKVPEFDAEHIRELIESPYRIIYRVHANRVEVLGVIHGARLLERVEF
jgi:addiction module RelE/StbE family toxin